MGSWTNIAALLSAKTKEGGLSVKPTEGLPFLLSVGMEVTFVPPVLRFVRSSKVSRIEEPSPGKYLVYFEDIHNRSDAEKLEGHFCLVPTASLPENFAASDALDIVDFVVRDTQSGVIGTVVRIQENPAHPLLVVRVDDAVESEVLIPLVDAFVDEVDEDQQCIVVSLPEGLLDL